MDIDFLLLNGTIWTGNPAQPWAEAIAAAGGQIKAVGSTADLKKLAGRRTTIIDAGRKLVLPGFIDNHTHFITGGFYLLTVNARGCESSAALADLIASRARELSPGRWITGGGWNQENWSPPQLPDKSLLDAAAPDHPVFVTRLDLHMGLANSLALKLAGIDRHTPNPAGGFIGRDALTGEPNGIVKDAAMDIITRVIPKPDSQEYGQALAAAMKHAASLGITSIQDITAWEDWETYRQFWQNGWLTLRVYARTPITDWERHLEARLAWDCGDDWLRLGGVKGFVDGALGSATALMFEPYSDQPGNSGLLFDQMFPDGIMKQRLTSSVLAGLPVSVHAIGDKANHLLLGIYEEIMQETQTSGAALRVEHAQHLKPEDITRLGRLGLTVSMQPVHLLDDGPWAPRRIGAARCRYMLACRSLLDAGAKLTFGTDWPVAPLNPLLGIYAAVTRQPQGLAAAFTPEERITVEEAVRAYTVDSACAEFADHRKGTLEPGKLSDMVVLSQNIFTIDPQEIPCTEVECTILNGAVLYRK